MSGTVYAYPVIPSAGMGNKLLPWARAEVFARKTGAKILSPHWMGLPRLGPWLFGEKDKRLYYRCFDNAEYVSGLRKFWILKTLPHIHEGEACDLGECSVVVEFTGHVTTFFTDILTEDDFLRERLWTIVKPHIRKIVDNASVSPFAAVHVRRGDFGRAGFGTDDTWYVKAIKAMLQLPESEGRSYIRIFSDAQPRELEFLYRAFPSERFVFDSDRPAIADILLMSRAKALVCSSHSTFSMWARFLGGMPTFWDAAKGDGADYIGGDMKGKAFLI